MNKKIRIVTPQAKFLVLLPFSITQKEFPEYVIHALKAENVLAVHMPQEEYLSRSGKSSLEMYHKAIEEWPIYEEVISRRLAVLSSSITPLTSKVIEVVPTVKKCTACKSNIAGTAQLMSNEKVKWVPQDSRVQIKGRRILCPECRINEISPPVITVPTVNRVYGFRNYNIRMTSI